MSRLDLAPRWVTRALVGTTTLVRQPYLATRMRVRSWGRLPADRRGIVLLANHQHEDESEIVVERTTFEDGYRVPMYTASTRRMYEPGFFAARFPVTAPLMRGVDLGPFFVAMGMLPIENQLAARPLGSLVAAALARHGDGPLDAMLTPEALAALPAVPPRLRDVGTPRYAAAAAQPVKLTRLHEPYRSEAQAQTRAAVDGDLARIRDAVAGGAAFYVTAEGDYSADGRMRPLRGIIRDLAAVGEVWLCAIAYDPFRGRRLSMLYRILRPADPADLAGSLAAARPVTASALLAAWLHGGGAPGDAAAAVAAAYDALPRTLFVDPELAHDPAGAAREAAAGLARLNGRRHPRFPAVADMVAFQAAFHAETLAATQRLAERAP